MRRRRARGAGGADVLALGERQRGRRRVLLGVDGRLGDHRGRRGLGAHDGGAAGRAVALAPQQLDVGPRALQRAAQLGRLGLGGDDALVDLRLGLGVARGEHLRLLGAQALHRLVPGGQLGLELGQARRELLARVALAAHLGLEALALAALAVRPAERRGRRLAGLVGEGAQRVGLAREPHVQVARAVRALVAVRRGKVEQLAPDGQGVFRARQEP